MTEKAHLVWCGPVDEATGYADEARGFLTALESGGIPVALRPMGHDATFRRALPDRVRKALERQEARGLAHPLVLVQHYLADGFAQLENATFQVGRTMFETDSLPSAWVDQCNRMNELWIPSRFNMETFARAGVRTPMYRVPGGVDVGTYAPTVPPLEVPGARGTVFLGVFEWVHRKGWDALLRAWADAFAPEDDVTLLIRSRIRVRAREAGHPSVSDQIDTFLRDACGRTRHDVAPIIVLDAPIPVDAMPSLYTRADALVAPTRGEGWGRPFTEAMASGRPVIATRWSAHLDFMHDENSLLIDVDRLAPARDEVLDVYDGHQWAEPSVPHLVSLLQSVHEDPARAQTLGARARAEMVAGWTWNHAVAMIVERLKAIGESMSRMAVVAPSAPVSAPVPASSVSPAEPAMTLPAIAESGAEHHLFVIWEHGRSAEARILADLAARFVIVSVTEIAWTPARAAENYTRFYGQKLPPGSFKEEHCGTGAFLAIVVRDDAPRYEHRGTSKGPRDVNARTFDAKQQYREWTGGGHRIHATDTVAEVRHDVALLFGETLAEHVARHAGAWDGHITACRADLAGSDGWRDLTHFFALLNETAVYLVLRNFEAYPHEFRPETHGDIDLLADSVEELAYAAHAVPDRTDSTGRHWVVSIGGESVVLDPKTPGDGYYDERWQHDMLARRRRHERGFDVPGHEDYFFSLLYHALMHKQEMASVYAERLIGLVPAIGLPGLDLATFTTPRRAKRLLDVYLTLKGYGYVRPMHPAVYYNENLLRTMPAGRIEPDALRAMPLLLPSDAVMSARRLTTWNRRPYDSIVYEDSADGTILKQATDDLAARDGELMSRVRGGYVPHVFETTNGDGWSSVRMERIEGEPLDRARKELAGTPRALAGFFDDCLQLLQALGDAGVQHRDIHDGNLLVRNGRPVIIDFGWALAADRPIFTPDGLGNDGCPPDGVHCDVYAMGRVFASCMPDGEDMFGPLIADMTAIERSRRVTDVGALRARLAALKIPGMWTNTPTTDSTADRHDIVDLDAIIARAHAADAAGDGAQARALLETTLRDHPDHLPLAKAAATLFIAQRYAIPDVIRLLRRAVANAPRDPAVGRLLAAALVHVDDYPAAAAEYARLVDADPADVHAWFPLGVCHLQCGAVSDAVQAFHRVLVLQPEHPEATAVLAALHPPAVAALHASVALCEQAIADRGVIDQDAVVRPVVSIVVPVHNQLGFTVGCLEALERTLPGAVPCEVIVVDDASSDDTPEFLGGAALRYPWLRSLRLEDNVGFARACNAGAAVAQGAHLVFLNNDTTPQDGWLDALLDTARRVPDAGVIGSLLLFPPAPERPEAPLRVQHTGIVFRDDLTSTHLYKFCYADQPFVRQSREYQAVTGACILIARALFESVGGFDTAYLNGGEDLELCFRVREQGRRVLLAADSVLWHHESASITTGHRPDNPNYRRFLTRWRERIVPDELAMQRADGITGLGLPRIAMVSPLRPVKSGVADVVRELTATLTGRFQVDLFTDDLVPSDPELVAHHRVHPVRDLASTSAIYGHDAVFFHIGNNHHHQTIATVASQVPGVVVLHEYDCRSAGYEASSRPHLQTLLRTAKAVVVHNEHSRQVLAEEFPSLPVYVVPLTLPPASESDRPRSAARARLGVAPDAFVVLSLGLVQYHKRNHVTVEAFARFARTHPEAQLVLAGEAWETSYSRTLLSLAEQHGIADRVRITGWVSDDEFFDWLGASDVTVNLRYPSRGEESATLTRILGSGRPACVSAYGQYADLPSEIVTHIGFEHEVDDLSAALERFHASPEARTRIAETARAHFREVADPARIADRYAGVIADTRDVTAASVLLRGNAYRHPGATRALVCWQTDWDDPVDPLRHLVRALDHRGVPSRVERIGAGEPRPALVNRQDALRLGELERVPLEQEFVQVYSGAPAHFVRQDRAGTAIALVRRADETTLREWARKPVDEYWVPSVWVGEALGRVGVPAARIVLVPAAVPGFTYRTNVHENRPDGVFRFVVCTDWSETAGLDAVLRAYLEVRRRHSDCALVFVSGHDDRSEDERDVRFAEVLAGFMQRHPQYTDGEYLDIRHERRSFAEDVMPLVYANAHAMVHPAVDAAGGRVVLEAMAVGLPVIVTAHGAHAEFATVGNSFPVPVVQKGDGRLVPDERTLQRYMRQVVEQRIDSQVRGIVARREVLAERTWAVVSGRVEERIRLALRGLSGATRTESASTHSDTGGRMVPA